MVYSSDSFKASPRRDLAAQDEVLGLLVEVDLEQFFTRIRQELQVTRICHFRHVKARDLSRIGLSDPAIRRLLEAARDSLTETGSSASSLFGSLRHKIGLPARRSHGGSNASLAKSTSSQAELCRSDAACLIRLEDLSLGETLGSGHFGVVKKATWRRGAAIEYVAVKVLRADLVSTDDRLAISDMISEVAVMHRLDHPNLVKLHGVCFGDCNMLVTELAPLGCLLDFMRRNTAKVDVTRIVSFAAQLARALDYLESKQYIHRDIALRNVLLTAEDVVKLGDFGLARFVATGDEHYVGNSDRKIPFAWSAPESLKYLEFTHASDTWMYGVAVWEMFTFGDEPWRDMRPNQILDELAQRRRLQKPITCSTSIYKMLLQCWRSDPINRPTFAGIVSYLTCGFFLEGKAVCNVSEPSEGAWLKMASGERLLVVDCPSDKRWWFGQNRSSLQFGYFLRTNVEFSREVRQGDLSRAAVPSGGGVPAQPNGQVDMSAVYSHLCFSTRNELSVHIQATELETRVTCRQKQPVARSPMMPGLGSVEQECQKIQHGLSTMCNVYAEEEKVSTTTTPKKNLIDLLHSPTRPLGPKATTGRHLFEQISNQALEQVLESPQAGATKAARRDSSASPARAFLKDLNSVITCGASRLLSCTSSHYRNQLAAESVGAVAGSVKDRSSPTSSLDTSFSQQLSNSLMSSTPSAEVVGHTDYVPPPPLAPPSLHEEIGREIGSGGLADFKAQLSARISQRQIVASDRKV